MSASTIDTILTSFRRSHTRAQGARDPRMRYATTRAAQLRFIDTGGSKPPLILTPDGPCVIEHYSDLIAKFSSHFRVICFDMPGQGFSFPSAYYHFGVGESADFIVELMDAVGIAKATFAFTCSNGIVAMNFAKRYPQRISHLVLGQTPTFSGMHDWIGRNIPKPLAVPYVGQIVGAIKAKHFASHWFDLALPRGSEHKSSFVEHALRAANSGGCFCLASVVQGLLHGGDQDILGVKCPTLSIFGDSDFSHRKTDFGAITEPIPHARLVAFSGCGHFPDLERSVEYVQQVEQFVLGSTALGDT